MISGMLIPAIKLVIIKNHINGSTKTNNRNGKEMPRITARIISKMNLLDAGSSSSILYD
jgi:hypothetical protein